MQSTQPNPATQLNEKIMTYVMNLAWTGVIIPKLSFEFFSSFAKGVSLGTYNLSFFENRFLSFGVYTEMIAPLLPFPEPISDAAVKGALLCYYAYSDQKSVFSSIGTAVAVFIIGQIFKARMKGKEEEGAQPPRVVPPVYAPPQEVPKAESQEAEIDKLGDISPLDNL